MSRILSQIKQKDGILIPTHLSSSSFSSPPLSSLDNNYQKNTAPPSNSSSNSKMSPVFLFIIVILAVIFFLSGLLHLLVRYLIKQRSSSSISESNRYREFSGSDAFQRQLQQLFHLHDSGLDQAYIDALPVFMYKEIMGVREPFDCAVCLCEFTEQDKLRLLPLCSHAFHIDCIDTWLLSNSTCPLCRGTIYTPGLPIENPVFGFNDLREEEGFQDSGRGNGVVFSSVQKPVEDERAISGKRVFSVRLGKFRSSNIGEGQREVGETSNSNLDARRCHSLGSYQYVVAESDLQVALTHNSSGGGANSIRLVKGQSGNIENMSINVDAESKKINIGSKGESFSVSKVWLWSNKKGKFPNSSADPAAVNVDFPWAQRTTRSQGT
ncbi:Zinc finger, RING-type [Dillenia turbinata]|uniref:RING-type E3 ubiquitin transferase n=1 Tax=Dillenia turbinata TaxID=194707 RepID=A0AAN8UZN3_9MAGN